MRKFKQIFIFIKVSNKFLKNIEKLLLAEYNHKKNKLTDNKIPIKIKYDFILIGILYCEVQYVYKTTFRKINIGSV